MIDPTRSCVIPLLFFIIKQSLTLLQALKRIMIICTTTDPVPHNNAQVVNRIRMVIWYGAVAQRVVRRDWLKLWRSINVNNVNHMKLISWKRPVCWCYVLPCCDDRLADSWRSMVQMKRQFYSKRHTYCGANGNSKLCVKMVSDISRCHNTCLRYSTHLS